MLDAQRAWDKLVQQYELGPRFCGAPGHRAAQTLLQSWLADADQLMPQSFSASFFGTAVACRNLWGRFHGDAPGRLLLGSHFDTRPWADRDPDPARQHDAVPGANDGASGVAVLAELIPDLLARRDRPTVDVVFFDAEDWHDIDGHSVSLGARTFVEQLPARDHPDAVLIVDMIAGADLILDVDVNCEEHHPSYDFTLSLFQLGRAMGLPAFSMSKPYPYKAIGCDHSPFAAADIASAILIDIDYPQWHTVDDVPAACGVDGLAQIGAFLETVLFTAAPLLLPRNAV